MCLEFLLVKKLFSMKKWILFSTMLVSIFLFSYQMSILIFEGYPILRGDQISLILSVSSSFLISITLIMQWRKAL